MQEKTLNSTLYKSRLPKTKTLDILYQLTHETRQTPLERLKTMVNNGSSQRDLDFIDPHLIMLRTAEVVLEQLEKL